MTKQHLEYIKKQLHIIDNKKSEDALRKYASSLYGAIMDKEVKHYLEKAIDVKYTTLTTPAPMVTHGDIEDILD